MIRFKVSVREGDNCVDSIFYECECGSTNIRGIIKGQDIRPFVCWKCRKRLPDIPEMYKNQWMRIRYHQTE